MTALVTDEMLDEMAVAGSPRNAGEQLAERRAQSVGPSAAGRAGCGHRPGPYARLPRRDRGDVRPAESRSLAARGATLSSARGRLDSLLHDGDPEDPAAGGPLADLVGDQAEPEPEQERRGEHRGPRRKLPPFPRWPRRGPAGGAQAASRTVPAGTATAHRAPARRLRAPLTSAGPTADPRSRTLTGLLQHSPRVEVHPDLALHALERVVHRLRVALQALARPLRRSVRPGTATAPCSPAR